VIEDIPRNIVWYISPFKAGYSIQDVQEKYFLSREGIAATSNGINYISDNIHKDNTGQEQSFECVQQTTNF
jgi:hypothetical protein